MHGDMCRKKISIDPLQSDKEIFSQLPMGDTWDDAELTSVFFYLYNSSGTKIPDSWYSCMKEFSRDLRTAVAADESVVAEYMQVRSSAM